MAVPRVIVVGAGISGLAAAYRLQTLARESGKPCAVTILDAAPKAGGVVSTVQKEGFLLEEGPDSFITDKPWALDLCRELGIEPDLIGVSNDHRKSFIARKGRLIPVPDGFYLLAPSQLGPFLKSPLFSPWGKLRVLAEMWIPPRDEPGDESLGSFVRRRLGREALDRAAQAMVGGIYNADPDTLSLESIFPRFLEMERTGGILRSLKRDRGKMPAASGPRYGLFATLKGGLGSLVKGLESSLPAVLQNTAVVSVSRAAGIWTVASKDGAKRQAEGLCLALPAPSSARLLRAVDEEAAQGLGAISCASSATVYLAYARSQIGHALDGFGFVCPASEGLPVIGCTFSSVKFPGRAPHGKVLLRAFLGNAIISSRPRLLSEVHDCLSKLLRIQGAPLWDHFSSWQDAMPQFAVGHKNLMEKVKGRIAGVRGLGLAGNADGLGLPDCIKSGRSAAEKIFSEIG